LLDVAKELYQHIIPYISGLSKDHKLTLNGHSIGGSISVLLLLLLTTDYGGKSSSSEKQCTPQLFFLFLWAAHWPFRRPFSTCDAVGFVRNTVKQVFTFGAPPVVTIAKHGSASATSKCAVLESFGLPLDLVKGYVQPWVSYSSLDKDCLDYLFLSAPVLNAFDLAFSAANRTQLFVCFPILIPCILWSTTLARTEQPFGRTAPLERFVKY